jgi:hypothetical protein
MHKPALGGGMAHWADETLASGRILRAWLPWICIPRARDQFTFPRCPLGPDGP